MKQVKGKCDEKYTFIITAEELSKQNVLYGETYADAKALYPLTDSGEAYDLLAAAAGQPGYFDAQDLWNLYEVRAESVEYVLKEYDYETAYIEELNGYTVGTFRYGSTVIDDDSARNDKWKKSGLLFGAYIALTHPDDFTAGLDEWTEKVKDAAHDCLGDFSGKAFPADLRKELQYAYDGMEREQYDEYLYGSYESRRNSWLGVYAMASMAIFGNRECIDANDEDRKLNRFTVTLTDELARGYMDEPDGPSPDIAQVKLAVMSGIVRSATSHYLKRQAEDDKRRESRAKEKDFKEERAKHDAMERVARLRAMIKR